MSIAGLVLAAGGGTRFGGPKVLARGPDGVPWVERALAALRDGGCSALLVAVGAKRDDALQILSGANAAEEVTVVPVAEWAAGISASIVAALDALAGESDVSAVVIAPVDVPSLSAAMVRRVIAAASDQPLPGALRQAVFHGRPGHPVLIGRDHWAPLHASLSGDTGARAYLVAHGVREIDCSDLGSGADVDERI